MPFTREDLERITVRHGLGTKTLAQMNDNQFMAWLRGHGAHGNIGVVQTAPGHVEIPMEERVRALNELEQQGFYIEEVMGTPPAEQRMDPELRKRALQHLAALDEHLQELDALIAQMGEVDPRVNLRASVHGANELIQLMKGAIQHAP